MVCHPALVQFGDERDRRALRKDFRILAVAIQEASQAFPWLQRLDQPCTLGILGESLLIGCAQEEPAQPVRKIAADQQQVALLQFTEERAGRVAAVSDYVVGVLQDVLVVDRKHGCRARLAEEVQQVDLARTGLPIPGQILSFAGR